MTTTEHVKEDQQPAVVLPPIELRVPVDAAEAPLGYDNHNGTLDVEVLLAGGGYTNLTLDLDNARMWAGNLFGAVTVAHREATGDPHALTDTDLAGLCDPDAYEPEQHLTLTGSGDRPARMRFVISLEVQGQVLCDAHLRAAIVGQLLTGFNTTHIGVSNAQPISGTPT